MTARREFEGHTPEPRRIVALCAWCGAGAPRDYDASEEGFAAMHADARDHATYCDQSPTVQLLREMAEALVAASTPPRHAGTNEAKAKARELLAIIAGRAAGAVEENECCGECGDVLDDRVDDMEHLRCKGCPKGEE